MENLNNDKISKDILRGFTPLTYSLTELPYADIYKNLLQLLPPQSISFQNMNTEKLLSCEIICSAICHKINWDFLRKTILEKTIEDPNWLEPQNLILLKSTDIESLLSCYEKKERILATERCKMLVEIGSKVLNGPKSFTNIFFDKDNSFKSYEEIFDFFMSINVFSSDPQQKKYQLLLQSLSDYFNFSFLSKYYKPTIDYHLIRLFLRRGIVKPTTAITREFILNPDVFRQEKTMASLRQVCAESLETICWITSLDIRAVNRIEWWVGRTICINGEPDCYLTKDEATWLKPCFNKCPYFDLCYAQQIDNKYLEISEPTYKGKSY